MPNLILLFSHRLTEEQTLDAIKSLGIENVLEMPDELKMKWSNIPADIDQPDILPFTGWLDEVSEPGDYLMIQGDYFMTFHLVLWAKQHCRIPVYSTTKRVSVEKQDESSQVVKTSVFKHVIFRKY
ncbi:MAG TPA: CRISPR-associated protein Csx20 [Candidatus Cloacimonadota bacterium]|nr:CRISPR-associated protein Csx20 [Candidatus Cloacimonadota bacterium]